MTGDSEPGPAPRHQVRAPRASELRLLAAIEDSGTAQYAAHLGEEVVGDALRSPAPTGGQRAAVPGFVLVTGRPVVGFVHVIFLDGHAHLEQVSVLPEDQRQGYGGALVGAALTESRRDGFRALSLCTYRDIAWNAPFYAGLGFAEVAADDLLPFQHRIREHEIALGLDASGPRLVMSAELRPDHPRPDGIRVAPAAVDPFVVQPTPPAGASGLLEQ